MFDLDCQGVSGPTTSPLHLVDQAGNRLQCELYVLNDANLNFDIICGASLAAIQTCAAAISSLSNLPHAFTASSDLRFEA